MLREDGTGAWDNYHFPTKNQFRSIDIRRESLGYLCWDLELALRSDNRIMFYKWPKAKIEVGERHVSRDAFYGWDMEELEVRERPGNKRTCHSRKLPRLALRPGECAICDETGGWFPTDHKWILRNLSTKQFVRAEAIAIRHGDIHGPHIQMFGFGEVVMVRTRWATSLSGDPELDRWLRGPWTGHRLDTMSGQIHDEQTYGQDWSDVSEEVAHEMAEFWDFEFRHQHRPDGLTWQALLRQHWEAEFPPSTFLSSHSWHNQCRCE
ncbi:hypothetical protein F5Y16DRAFT_423218 [Xylariaceae sp. FL0255]|nr:hypothetical protein F5Y16DRAFT_423218 [Xylariaceae sp. FL0255]